MISSLGLLWRARSIREPALMALALLLALVFLVHRASGWGDVALYHSYATYFWAGPHAFRMLPAEYPPLSIVVFSLTLVPAIQDYATVFALWMGATFMAGFYLFQRFSDHRRAVLYAFYLLLGAAATLLGRFDILPALAVMGAIWAARRQSWRWAYLLLAIGVLLKVYPLLLAPLFLVEQRRSLQAGPGWTRAVVASAWPAGLVLVGCFATAVLIDPGGTISPLLYASARPLQVESAPASVLWIFSFLGFTAESERSFRSFNLVGPLGPGIGSIFSVLTVLGLCWTYWRHYQARIDLARAVLAVVCIAIVTSKVFSPQYLIWVLPLVAEVEDFRWDWVAISAITALIYPVLYMTDQLIGTPGPFPYAGDLLFAVLVRNTLFGVATVRALFPQFAWRPMRESAPMVAGD